MPEISVIVPVYNTAEYLPRCLESLLAQTFPDFEILLIDDGSTDNSALVCKAYSVRDSRVRLITSAHVGVGAVRNFGLENANGRFIMFCDSDDYVEPEWMETLFNHAVKYPDSLVNCEYANAVPSENYVEVKTLKEATRSQQIDKIHFFPMTKTGMALHLWTRIFRADIIRENNLSFPTDMREGEDMVFIAMYMRFCGSFYYIKKCLYYWTDNLTDTLSRSYHPYCFEDLRAIYSARKPLIDRRYMQDFFDDAFERFLKSVDVVRDERNTDPEWVKTRYCQKIFRDPVFQETVKNVSRKACSRKKRAVLRLKSYRLYSLARKLNSAK